MSRGSIKVAIVAPQPVFRLPAVLLCGVSRETLSFESAVAGVGCNISLFHVKQLAAYRWRIGGGNPGL